MTTNQLMERLSLTLVNFSNDLVVFFEAIYLILKTLLILNAFECLKFLLISPRRSIALVVLLHLRLKCNLRLFYVHGVKCLLISKKMCTVMFIFCKVYSTGIYPVTFIYNKLNYLHKCYIRYKKTRVKKAFS